MSSRTLAALTATGLALALLAAPAATQGGPLDTVDLLELLVMEGDDAAGVGAVTRIDNLAINDLGEWLVEVDTDAANTDADGALLGPGGLVFQEGQALAEPLGSMLGSFGTLALDDDGDGAFNFFLDGTSGFDDDSGVFFNDELLIQEGDETLAVGLTLGTPYIGFFGTKLNESGVLLVMTSIDDPNITSGVDRALITKDSTTFVETLVAAEGDVLPGQVEPVEDFETGPHDYAFNASGQVMFIADLAGDSSTDGAVYLDGALLAQEGSLSPVGGRSWSSLGSAEVDLNDHGDYLISGTLDGDSASNSLIELSGTKFVQEGDTIVDNAFDTWTLTSFGTGPVWLGNNGNVLWYGDWDNPDTSVDTGLFLNDQLIVQEGVSTIGGVPIDDIRGIQEGYVLGDDGQWLAFRAVLDGGDDVAVRIRIGPFVSLGQGLAGTGGVVPQLRMAGSLVAGEDFTAALVGAAPNAANTLVFSLTNLSAPFKGGTLVPAPDFLLGGAPTSALGTKVLDLSLPPGVPGGLDVFIQYWIADPGGFSGFSASNGIRATTP